MVSRRATYFLLPAVSLLAPAAWAQTSPAPPAPASPTAVARFVTDQDVGEFRASKFAGLGIYGPDGVKVGDVNDVLIDGQGQAKSVVIGVGGFLGIGEKNVAVPWSGVTWVLEKPRSVTAGSPVPPAGAAPPTAVAAPPTPGAAPPPAGASQRLPAELAAANGYPDHGTINLTKADLQNAPEFKYYGQTHPAPGK